ncbi:MAG: multifunctional CCA addition/repair protein [Gammaproteobacteria bacterium]|nr:multifunctional CCA addition/repair protein [Gammaproteobacteria bacterium]
MKIYLVGGAVRDKLLGLPVHERDWLVVGATPEEMLAQGYRPVGKDFPVFLHPETHEEYALARTERKSGHGYHGFTMHAAPDVTLEQDLLRRDLTINAIVETPQGELIDPYGGQDDLRNGTLRHVSPAFAEDPVRILRVARFAARFARQGFRVSEDTNILMQDMIRSGEADYLVAERVWKEMEKALGEDEPMRFFEVLRACGGLAVLFPEIEALFGVPQPLHYHPEEDTGIHTMMVLEQAARLSQNTTIRFAALVHDLGKALTPKEEWPSHHGHEGRGEAPLKQLCDRLKVPREYRELAQVVTQYHGHYHRACELRPATLLKLLKATDIFRRPQRLGDFLLACKADSRGRLGFEDKEFPQGDYLQAAGEAVRAIDTQALLDEGWQGKELGEELDRRRVQALAQMKKEYVYPGDPG